jgi:hypothetical protein
MPRRVPRQVTIEREIRAWDLSRQCWTQERIAEELGIDQSAVSLALRRVERRALEQLSECVLEVKARQTFQLENIANEAMDAWERSKLDAEATETTEEETVLEGAGGGQEIPATNRKTKRSRKGQTGDPRHLDNVMKALAEIRTIWGVEAPKRADLTSGGKSVPIQIIEVVRPGGDAQAPN